LDLLFQNSPETLVIPITYKNNTSFTSNEVFDWTIAVKYFCIRVLKLLLGLTATLEDLFQQLKHNVLNLNSVQEYCSNIFTDNSFFTDDNPPQAY
jgi:hypothetical protein